jgi:hypothetical protein
MADLRMDLVNRLVALCREIPRVEQDEDPAEFRDALKKMNPIVDELQVIVIRLLLSPES